VDATERRGGTVEGSHVVLFDGPCALCNRSVRFLVQRDRRGVLRFATLQGPVAEAVSRRHGGLPAGDGSVYVVVEHGTPDERLLARSAAVFFLLETLGGIWRLPALLSRLPTAWTDRVYDWVARRRYRLFGTTAACSGLDPAHRDRLLDR
jgi:predicted DCC family thiol-disulfide oxidoreductase YuxK